MGIMPSNVGELGDVEKASKVFVTNELKPLQRKIHNLNDWLGSDIINFDAYEI